MGKKIVGMMSSYPGMNQSDWLWQQTPQPFGAWGNIQMMAQAPEPDFLVMYQYDFYQKLPQPKTGWNRLRRSPLIKQVFVEPQVRGLPAERILYLLREPPLEEVVAKNRRNYEAAAAYCGYISGPDQFAPHPEPMPAIWYHGNAFRELNEMPPPEKVRPLSWITSGIDRTVRHRQRLDFLRLICESGLDCDLYGRNLPDWTKSWGALDKKWHGMAPYTYNLTVENYADNDLYVTEKLWDALLAWCLPIYHGGSAADRLLPPGSFLRLPSLDEKGLAYIREVTATPDAWYEARAAIAEARQIILHKLNLLNWLSEFIQRLSA
ncbi:glycosyltransferase [Leptolyngbya sp. 'hensonii']|uniref:glycosyltransferase family 10 domain-containing protein n=1 Tax=Leptolyngbya sp. 'hensonii' TaxID=1922337 RepID=UPI00095032CA|nr:glycosyltransferase family 10 [Leptolyngbya sp. 'hensonii']OLP17552.1 glycosyltransferase [Leptolyngbya sp. 'hensonii']